MFFKENSAYAIDDDMSLPNHYENLNDQVWIIPRNLLNIQHMVLLGQGKFGLIHSGTVQKESDLQTVAVYSIADKKLAPSEKRSMLRELDTLIRADKHQNVLQLIGTCESVDTVCIVLENSQGNLKELLLNSRNNLPSTFCILSENQLLDIGINIAKGMAHLESKKVSIV